MLHLYNSLSRQKEVFKPLEANKVGMYVCGITVYDYCHMGHARTYVAFDVIVRYLRFAGYGVNYVRNITDIDDKIIKRAQERGVSIDTVTNANIAAMHEDFEQLNLLPADVEPKATDSISEIIAMVAELIAKDAAYVGENGDVYYAVDKFDGYGKLSVTDLEQLQAGERVEVDGNKKNHFDFVLWKAAKPGEPAWESPWGPGRPGWHIECSAMAKKCLGEHFDIHGGGSDLQFPHHENEIAQSEAANGCQFVNYWMHTGMVQVDNEKMSKSLGNFFTIRDVLKNYKAEELRYFLLSGHYRSQLQYTDENINQAACALERLYNALREIEVSEEVLAKALDQAPVAEYVTAFKSAMDDDFNTPKALAVLFEVAKAINLAKKEGKPNDDESVVLLAATLKVLGGVLGVLQQAPDAFLKCTDAALDEDAINALIAQRDQARKDKDWALADKIRDQLQSMNIILEDGAGQGTRWRVEKNN